MSLSYSATQSLKNQDDSLKNNNCKVFLNAIVLCGPSGYNGTESHYLEKNETDRAAMKAAGSICTYPTPGLRIQFEKPFPEAKIENVR